MRCADAESLSAAQVVSQQTVTEIESISLDTGIASIRHVEVAMPFLSNRDFAVVFGASPAISNDGSSEMEECDDWVVGSVSVEQPALPELKGCTRGHTVMNGWHIKPLPIKDGVDSCGVTVVSITCLRGSLPSAMLSMAAKEGAVLVRGLQKACGEIPANCKT